jgi:hypothetical protein
MPGAAAATPDEPGTRIHGTADVERALSLVRDRAAGRATVAALPQPVGRAHQLRELRPDPPLPVAEELRELLPDGGLKRGSVVAVEGSRLLMLALLGEASKAGAWIAAIGFPELGITAAHEAGIVLERLVLVPDPGTKWLEVMGVLIDGMQIVVAQAPPGGVTDAQARTLTARARQRGTVLIPIGRGLLRAGLSGWPSPDLVVERTGGRWHGIGMGHGRLRWMEAEITSRGRGGAVRPRRCTIALPLICRPDDWQPPGDRRHLRAVGRTS